MFRFYTSEKFLKIAENIKIFMNNYDAFLKIMLKCSYNIPTSDCATRFLMNGAVLWIFKMHGKKILPACNIDANSAHVEAYFSSFKIKYLKTGHLYIWHLWNQIMNLRSDYKFKNSLQRSLYVPSRVLLVVLNLNLKFPFEVNLNWPNRPDKEKKSTWQNFDKPATQQNILFINTQLDIF